MGKSAVDNARAWVKRRVADALHRAEGRLGYFLPYHLSSLRKDEFFSDSASWRRPSRSRRC